MKLTTNIVLAGNYGRTQSYIIQLVPGTTNSSYKYVHQNDETWPGQHGMFFDSSAEYVLSKKGNEWNTEEDLDGQIYSLRNSTLRVYFPQYSVDTFNQNCIYILNAFIYIKGREIELGCFKFQRKNSLACPPKRFDGMDEYYEYIDFEMPDPYDIYFDRNINLPEYIKNHSATNNAARLYLSLYVVEPYENKYIMKEGWAGGQNNINIAEYNPLKVDIKYDEKYNDISLDLDFNGDYGSYINEYIEEVYNQEVSNNLKWELVIMDDENIYFQWLSILDENYKMLPSNYSDFNNDYNDDFNSITN